MPNYKVNDGYRVSIEGVHHVGGQTVELSREQADTLIADGVVTSSRTAPAHKAEVKAEDKSEG